MRDALSTLKLLVVGITAALIVIFAVQNGGPVSVRLFHWRLDGVAVAGVILFATAAGMVLVGVPLWIDRWRLQARVRALERLLPGGPRRDGPAGPPEETEETGDA